MLLGKKKVESGSEEESASKAEEKAEVVCRLSHACRRMEQGSLPPCYYRPPSCDICDADGLGLDGHYYNCRECEFNVCQVCVREKAEFEAG